MSGTAEISGQMTRMKPRQQPKLVFEMLSHISSVLYKHVYTVSIARVGNLHNRCRQLICTFHYCCMGVILSLAIANIAYNNLLCTNLQQFASGDTVDVGFSANELSSTNEMLSCCSSPTRISHLEETPQQFACSHRPSRPD